jgi:protein O-GlcNAc transferase
MSDIDIKAPRMSEPERELFLRYLKNATHYFEFGGGGSTVWATQQENIQTIQTVETDRAFAVELQKQCPRAQVTWIDVGETGEWGFPVNKEKRDNWPLYYGAIKKSKVKPDLILVDGRFRVACAIMALYFNAFVLVHDFTREHYRPILDYYDIVEHADTLAVLRRKNYIELAVEPFRFDAR